MCDSGTHVQPTQKDGGKGSATRLGCSGAPLRPGDCRPAAFALTHGTALRRRRRHARCSTPSAADAKHGAKSRPETCIRTHSVEPVRYSPACAHALTVKRPPTSPQTKSLCSAAALCTSRTHKNRPAHTWRQRFCHAHGVGRGAPARPDRRPALDALTAVRGPSSTGATGAESTPGRPRARPRSWAHVGSRGPGPRPPRASSSRGALSMGRPLKWPWRLHFAPSARQVRA